MSRKSIFTFNVGDAEGGVPYDISSHLFENLIWFFCCTPFIHVKRMNEQMMNILS